MVKEKVLNKYQKQLRHRTDIMYWLTKEEIPQSKFLSLFKLCKKLQVKDLDIDIKGNVSYTSNEWVSEKIQAISTVMLKQIIDEINKAELFSLMCDETTDKTVTKQLIICARYLLNGTVHSRFIGLRDLDKCDAESIRVVIIRFLHEHGLKLEKMIGFGSDGASTFTRCI
jgi:hypothetical protein